MVDYTALVDLDHTWGSDVALSPSGSFGTVKTDERSKQRVLRRLMTPRGGYIFHSNYGFGLGERIGEILDVAETTGAIREQMKLEDSVSQTDPISISVSKGADGGVAVSLDWTSLPDRKPVSLSFDINI